MTGLKFETRLALAWKRGNLSKIPATVVRIVRRSPEVPTLVRRANSGSGRDGAFFVRLLLRLVDCQRNRGADWRATLGKHPADAVVVGRGGNVALAAAD